WRTLGSVFIEPGDHMAGGGSRYFSLHPNGNALTFTGGGMVYEERMMPDFGQVLEQWKKARQ
ncbi:MAG: hypothetical protein ABIF09_12695, partial [Gemmatimonadota bacterium]